MAWNDPQTQSTMTWTYLKQAKKYAKQPTTSRFWNSFKIWGKRFSSLTRYPPNIWLPSFEQSLYYHVHFLRDIRLIFFCLDFVSRAFTNQRAAGKWRGYFFLAPLQHFHRQRKSFGLQRLQLLERLWMRTLWADPGSILHFFIIKTSMKLNKGAAFLDLLLNISFQPLIIVVKLSIVKLDVTEM